MEKLERDNKYFFTLLFGVLIGTFISIFIYTTIFIFSNNTENNSSKYFENISNIKHINESKNIENNINANYNNSIESTNPSFSFMENFNRI